MTMDLHDRMTLNAVVFFGSIVVMVLILIAAGHDRSEDQWGAKFAGGSIVLIMLLVEVFQTSQMAELSLITRPTPEQHLQERLVIMKSTLDTLQAAMTKETRAVADAMNDLEGQILHQEQTLQQL